MAGPAAIMANRPGGIVHDGNWEKYGEHGQWRRLDDWVADDDPNDTRSFRSFIGQIQHKFRVGDTVRCRNGGGQWQTGTVTRVDPHLRVRPKGHMFDDRFTQVEKVEQKVKKVKEEKMPTAEGVVRSWYPNRGFGILECTGGDYRGYGEVYCHQSTIGADFELKVGGKVSFCIWQNADTKKFEANNIRGSGLVPKDNNFFSADQLGSKPGKARKAPAPERDAPSRPSLLGSLTLPKKERSLSFNPGGSTGTSTAPAKKKRKKNTEAGGGPAEC